MPTAADPVAAPVAIRTRVRARSTRRGRRPSRPGRWPRSKTTPPRPPVEVERPANAAFGDLATNLAMKLARPLRRAPLDIAEAVAASLKAGGDNPLLVSAEVARPGFVNLRVADAAYEELVAGSWPRRRNGAGSRP